MRLFIALTCLVALAACTPLAETGSAEDQGFIPPERFTALGTEPFWAAKVVGGNLVWSTPENQAGTRISVTRSLTRSSLQLRGTLGSDAFVLVLSAGDCSDGMSDTRYRLRATVRLGSRLLNGCAQP